jgi:hypothetical protein
MNPPNCIVCREQLSAVYPGSVQPSGGTLFSASGNYGSTVFDPMRRGISLTVVICDVCLPDRKVDVLYTTVRYGETTYVHEPWDGD